MSHAAQPFLLQRFDYRRNSDGSLDSICLSCFYTVGSGWQIRDLVQAERLHRCVYRKKPPSSENGN